MRIPPRVARARRARGMSEGSVVSRERTGQRENLPSPAMRATGIPESADCFASPTMTESGTAFPGGLGDDALVDSSYAWAVCAAGSGWARRPEGRASEPAGLSGAGGDGLPDRGAERD